jgi:predicted phosphoribosyltransferase/dienelactone hydrolase
VLFAHGSGSGRLSERNQYVAGVLQQGGIATLLFDLLTESESEDRRNVFDIPLLARRLREAADWVRQEPGTSELQLGYFGASTGAGAALVAATRNPQGIQAIVSRGGRPDLAADDLPDVQAPTLLIVGGDDAPVIEMNNAALDQLRCEKKMVIIPGATHLFPEPGALEEVADLARDWFAAHFGSPSPAKQETPVTAEVDPPSWGGALFRDRDDAGRQVAARLKALDLADPLVLGIPRGGVVIGATIARELGADLDIVLSRKLRAPMQPELAVGAVAENGNVYLTSEAKRIPDVTDDYLAAEQEYQLQEIHRRRQLFRPIRPAASVSGRSVILTDDGIATGSTMIAALEVIRAQRPRELIVAVPVGAPERLEPIRTRCDRLICLYSPEQFWGIGQFYMDFRAVEDSEVVEILREFAPVDVPAV